MMWQKADQTLHTAVFGEHGHTVDEAFLEGGINAYLAQLTNKIPTSEAAIRAAKKFFLERVNSTLEAIMADCPQPSHGRKYSDRDIKGYVQYAADVIVEYVSRLLHADPPVRINHQRRVAKTDAWYGTFTSSS
jgi:hypothetical protein